MEDMSHLDIEALTTNEYAKILVLETDELDASKIAIIEAHYPQVPKVLLLLSKELETLELNIEVGGWVIYRPTAITLPVIFNVLEA